MATLAEIEKSTCEFADKRAALLALVQELQDEIEGTKRKRLPAIKEAAADLTIAHEALYAEVEGAAPLFEKPKTRTFAGIRVGFKKEKGKIVIEDEETTIALIRKVVPKLADQLVQKKEYCLKTGLEQLPAATLKMIGVTITADTDAVYIKPIGDDIDKFVGALLEEGEKLLREVA
ncbi:hypothetical protein DSOUD_0842 [Desulfuromonas soudanensis]|uniref:Uncharacterized protein n=1 Tax=Desulfuromonas soudanensis TaxID=1603606 RepID=A0A0M3QF55_9BACT|nr:host-nuclease inhibitor Gam family protein [Desulfuromonas soudanensis]ALC15629.1 hypothetical protein DSOUD_0842 [Desulfuromonas soudanensis]